MANINNPDDSRYKQLKQILDEILYLKDSPLYEYRKINNNKPVIGEGTHYASIMFVGEAPGENEAKQGRPFCGAAGRILDELLASIGLARNEVYITNLVKDRPPNNRDPLPDEIELYSPYLDRQIEIIQPKCIATLGRHSMKYLMEKYGLGEKLASISVIHGHKFDIKINKTKTAYIPLYPPAVALYTASKKKTLIDDFQVLKNFS